MSSKEHIFDLIVVHAREVVPDLSNHSFSPTDSMKALGLSSIDRTEVILMTLESLSLSIPMIAMANAKSIGDLVAIIHARS